MRLGWRNSKCDVVLSKSNVVTLRHAILTSLEDSVIVSGVGPSINGCTTSAIAMGEVTTLKGCPVLEQL